MQSCWVAVLLFVTAAACGAAATDAASSDKAARLDRFNAYFHSLSATNRKLEIKDGTYGASVFVAPGAADIRKMEVVMEVPTKHCFSDASIAQKPYGAMLNPSAKGAPSEENRIALAIAVEFLLGNSSLHFPWMQALPRLGIELNPPHLWPRNESSLIEPATLRSGVLRRTQELRREWDDMLRGGNAVKNLDAWVAKRVTEAGGPPPQEWFDESAPASHVPGKGLKMLSLPLFSWAKTLLDTRAWNVAGRKYFVPAADMYNHAPDAEDIAFDAAQRPLVLPRSQKFLMFHKMDPASGAKVLSDRGGVKAGEELHESYGDNTDEIYFKYHGFVPAAPETFVQDRTRFDMKRWVAARRERNTWDCQPLNLLFSRWYPEPWSLRLLNGTSRPPKKQRRSSAATTQRERVPVAWLRERLQPYVRGSDICVYPGVPEPVLELFHTVSVLPERVIEGNCMKRLRVDASKKHIAAFSALVKNVVTCVQEEAPPAEGRKAEMWAVAYAAAGLRAYRASLRWFAALEFKALNIDADVAQLAALTAPDAESAMSPLYTSMQVTRLRMALQRKVIVRDLLKRVKRALKVAERKLAAMVAAEAAEDKEDL